VQTLGYSVIVWLITGGLALVGCGDGALYVIDIREGKTLYALGAHKVRAPVPSDTLGHHQTRARMCVVLASRLNSANPTIDMDML
jgi:hypothetical protein